MSRVKIFAINKSAYESDACIQAKLLEGAIQYNTKYNKIYIAPGMIKRIRAQTHGVTRQ